MAHNLLLTSSPLLLQISDLGHPPATHDTPPGTHMGSLQSDSVLSSAFRSRSRSDGTNTSLFCRQNVGTIVLFPNRLEKQSNSEPFFIIYCYYY